MRTKVVNTFLFAVLLTIGLLQFKTAFFEQSKFSSRPQKSSRLWRQQINPAYLTKAANNACFSRGDGRTALRMLQKALSNDPFHIPAWIGLSELKLYQNNKTGALAILYHIDSLMTEVGRWRWQKTMLAYQLGETEMVARDLDYIIDKLPGQRRKALDLAFSLWSDSKILSAKIGNHNLPHLFRYSLNPERLDRAIDFWPHVRKNPALDRRRKLYFIELLRRRGEITSAHSIWKQEIEADHLLHNGNFGNKPLQTAFGWRISKPVGTIWELLTIPEDERSTFHLHFTGTENVNYYHLRQHIALVPGRSYTLRGVARCENLTTDQRPYLEVIGVKAKNPRVKTPMFADSQNWQPFILNFTVPLDCEQVYVRLRRNKSFYIDNQISGDLWLTDLSIISNEMTDE